LGKGEFTAIITKPKTFVNDEKLLYTDLNSLFDTVYNEFNGSISNTNIDSNADISPTKISGTAVTLSGVQTLTNKTITSPKINEAVELTSTATEINNLHSATVNLGAWVSFTPSWTNLTVGNGTNTGFYCQIGKLVIFRTSFTFGSSSSIGTGPSITPPTSQASHGFYMCGTANLSDGASWFTGACDSNIAPYYSYPFSGLNYWSGLSATTPWTWNTNDVINLYGSYEAA
jgi:hypothetical protein